MNKTVSVSKARFINKKAAFNKVFFYNRAKQNGLSLIELMIALVLGLILTGGALQVFISSKSSFSVMESNSQLLQNGRMGLEFLTQSIRMAGFRESVSTDLNNAFPAEGAFAVGQVITGTDTSVSVRYQGYPDNINSDCQGNAVVSGATATVSYRFHDNKLTCDFGASSQTIVENIDQLQFRYGVAAIGSNEVQQYKQATAITPVEWPRVKSVRIGMIANSGVSLGATKHVATHLLFGQAYSFENANPTDNTENYLREKFETTVGLWNLMQ